MRENSSKKSETILSGVSSQSLAEGTPILATWQPGDTDAKKELFNVIYRVLRNSSVSASLLRVPEFL